MNIQEIFESNVFNKNEIKKRLPKETINELQKTIEKGVPLNIKIANAIAQAMKQWAIEKEVTHYSHWFQPMNGITAEKHESFLHVENNQAILSFSGKELIQQESDASSFPSGTLRSTFEARGYTIWDPTSPVFIKDKTLFIPTAFCSYTGHALDKKTPLLRSMSALNKQALRILKIFGNEEVFSVKSSVGSEQEYFLIQQEDYEKRKDLIYTGRTLFGKPFSKGQEYNSHYFGKICPQVSTFMQELNEELWKLGICAKTQHNEVAPCQFEIAPFFSTANIACDQNQIIMEFIQKISKKHKMVALLHEKPFKGINGSGKHNNWSLITNNGINLLEPKETYKENLQFLLFLCAIIQAVDNHQDLLRMSISSASNDHRLGGHEAPPAILSIYLGEELTNLLNAIEFDEIYENKQQEFIQIVDILPKLSKDYTDRNRTSPFAFTGNKFEFRMPGSQSSITSCNMILNTIVADTLEEFSNEIENNNESILKLLKTTIKNHKHIIYNGNNYDDSWKEESNKRGLIHLESSIDAYPVFLKEKNIQLFEKQKVLNKEEINARYEILMNKYSKTIQIEAITMIELIDQDILPSTIRFLHELNNQTIYEKEITDQIKQLINEIYINKKELEKEITSLTFLDYEKEAYSCKEQIIPIMNQLRNQVDNLEKIMPSCYWPMPSYNEILTKL